MATGKALIDVQKGELKLKVQEEEVTFNVFNAMRYLVKSDSCFCLETMEAIVSNQWIQSDPLETTIL